SCVSGSYLELILLRDPLKIFFRQHRPEAGMHPAFTVLSRSREDHWRTPRVWGQALCGIRHPSSEGATAGPPSSAHSLPPAATHETSARHEEERPHKAPARNEENPAAEPCTSGRGCRGQRQSRYAEDAGNLDRGAAESIGQDYGHHGQAANQEGS